MARLHRFLAQSMESRGVSLEVFASEARPIP